MPQWDKDKIHWEDTGQKIAIIPKPFWRDWFKFLPYFVGDVVKFNIKITGELLATQISDTYYIHEYFDEKYTEYWPIKESTLFSGNRIDREGSVKYRISILPTSKSYVFFTAHVINRDRWALGCLGLVAGIIGTLITEIVLRLLKVRPFWEIWIP